MHCYLQKIKVYTLSWSPPGRHQGPPGTVGRAVVSWQKEAAMLTPVLCSLRPENPTAGDAVPVGGKNTDFLPPTGPGLLRKGNCYQS